MQKNNTMVKIYLTYNRNEYIYFSTQNGFYLKYPCLMHLVQLPECKFQSRMHLVQPLKALP